MNEDLEKSLFLNFPLFIIGMGIIAPIYTCGPLRTNAMLGFLAMLLLMIAMVTLATLRPGTPKNGRVGVAVLIAGGLLTIAKVTLSAVPLTASLPVETLAPLMLIAAVLASVTDAYDVKKKLSLAFPS